MILPVIAYGNPILKQKSKDISSHLPWVDKLIKDMWKTLYAANGAGLAAPQVGRLVRLFIVDTVQVYDHSDIKEKEMFIGDTGIKEVFINPNIIEISGKLWTETEGCLSLPGLDLEIERNILVTIKYLDENFSEHKKTFIGTTARTILHEYDHIEGVLISDYKNYEDIKDELIKISRGLIKVDYRMKFNN